MIGPKCVSNEILEEWRIDQCGVVVIYKWILAVQIPNLAQIFLIGFYDEREFALYVSSISNELKVPVR